MVTALGEPGDIERAVAAGCNDFLSKPINKLDFLKRVEILLELRHVKDELERLRRYIDEMEGDRPKRKPQRKRRKGDEASSSGSAFSTLSSFLHYTQQPPHARSPWSPDSCAASRWSSGLPIPIPMPCEACWRNWPGCRRW